MQADTSELGTRPFHTLTQAARILGVGPERARRMKREGKLGPVEQSGRGPARIADAALRRIVNGESVSAA